jgi:hypothetical protein
MVYPYKILGYLEGDRGKWNRVTCVLERNLSKWRITLGVRVDVGKWVDE